MKARSEPLGSHLNPKCNKIVFGSMSQKIFSAKPDETKQTDSL